MLKAAIKELAQLNSSQQQISEQFPAQYRQLASPPQVLMKIWFANFARPSLITQKPYIITNN
jgi:hypothetical protein